ncbi:MAG: protein-export chaperone SecB [Gammaproteobacteria bacterium]|jgi:preprotein translocase subunit SecB|nr:protein-export chaperone SecB [Chromatiales bacterium]MDP6673843.1 protein-export chaperone SecB [Gammaproteobacteria bacterium]
MTDEQFSRKLSIERIVLRDMSFETPMGQDVFAGTWKPDCELNLQLRNVRLAEDLWEVILTATINAKVENGVAFLIEAQQAGVFKVPDLEPESLSRALAIEAPNLIYPFLRESVDNMAARGGFPPVNLQLFDFEARYAAMIEKANRSKPASGGEP